MNYNYSGAAAYAKAIGVEFFESWVENFDQQAQAFGFSQAQVDIAMQHHLWHVKFLFSPKTYNFKQRLMLAGHFLFGRKK